MFLTVLGPRVKERGTSGRKDSQGRKTMHSLAFSYILKGRVVAGNWGRCPVFSNGGFWSREWARNEKSLHGCPPASLKQSKLAELAPSMNTEEHG